MAERTNPHANLIIGAQDEATPVFEQIKASSQSMAAGVEQAATKAAGAVGGIGDKAAPAAQKLDSVTASMIRQVQRLNAELESGGARNAAYIEKMASIKGADLSAMAPYLEDLKKAEAAQRVATTGLDNMGLSAKQTAAALRQVPMQFTDIVVSLAGGQSAMQVFLQQGGQLKDVFGGAGNAARAMGGYVLGLINPLTVTAAALGVIALAYKQGSAEADAYNMALITTGNAAGTTASQMQQMAGRISSVVGTQGAAAEALAQMAASGRVASDSLEYFSQVAIKFERSTGTAISETVQRFAELGASPVEASRKLNEQTNYLTTSIYEQIKSLKEQGREYEAAALAQNTYADALNNRSNQIVQNLGAIEKAWKAIKDGAKGAWDSMLNVGRTDTLQDQLDRARANLEQRLNTPLAVDNPAMRASRDKGIESLRNEIALLTEQERMMRRGATAQAERAQAEKQGIEAADALQKTQERGLSKQQQMNKALEEYSRHIERLKATNPNSALLSPEAIARGQKAIRDQYADKGGAKSANKDLEKQAKLIAELNGLTGGFAEEWDRLSAAYARGAMSMEELTKEQATLLAKQPAIKAAAEEEAKARQAVEKADIGAAAAREKYVASLISGLDKIQADIAAQEEATARLGLSKQAIADLDAAKLEMLATDLELQAIKAMDLNLDEQTYDALKQQAQAYRDLAKAKQAGAAKEVAVDEAKKAADEWQRTSDQISQSITDALMRGFESGKDFAKNLRDTVVNMFKSLVLQPIVKGIVSPFAGALTGALGLAGTAAQAGQGTSGISTALSGASLLSSFGGALAGGAGWLTGATSFGGALSAGASLMGTGTVAGATSGLGMLAGALGPIALGIGLLTSFIKKPTPHSGAGVTYSAAGGLTSGASQYSKTNYGFGAAGEYSAESNTAVASVAKGIATALDSTAVAFGKKAGFEISTAFADDKSKDGAWGQLAIKLGGQKVLDWRDTQTSKWAPKEFADGEAGLKEYQAAVAASMRDALSSLDLPGWVDSVLQDLGDAPALEDMEKALSSIAMANDAMAALGSQIGGLSGLSDEAKASLIDAFGGVETFAATASEYANVVLTDAEKVSLSMTDISSQFEALGMAVPSSVSALQDLISAQDLTTDAGREAVASLMTLGTSFATVMDQMQQSIGLTGDSLKSVFQNVLKQAHSAEEARVMGEQAAGQLLMDAIGNALVGTVTDLVSNAVLQPITQSIVGAAAQAATMDVAAASTAGATLAAGGAAGATTIAAGSAAGATSLAAGGAAGGANVAAGGAAAGQGLADIVGKAISVTNAMVDIMNNADFQTAFGNAVSAIGSISSTLFGGMTSIQTSMPGFAGGGSAAISSGGGGGGGSSSLDNKNPLDDLLEERRQLEIQLLQAQGQKQEALNRIRAKAIEGMTAEAVAMYDANRALEEQIRVQLALNDFAKEGKQLQAELLKLQGSTAAAKDILRTLAIDGMSELEIAAYDANEALREQINTLQERQGLEERLANLLGNSAYLRERERAAISASNLALYDQVVAIEDAQTAAQDALNALKKAAQAEQERVRKQYEAQTKALQESITAISDVVRDLDSALKSIRDTLDESTIQSQTAARLTLQSVLTAVQGGSSVSAFADVIKQSSGTLAKNDPQLYAQREQYIKSQAQAAGLLGTLNEYGEGQLDTAERQLKTLEEWRDSELERLDGMVTAAEQQYNAVMGIKDVTLSINDAVQGFDDAIAALGAAMAGAIVGAKPSTGGNYGTIGNGGSVVVGDEVYAPGKGPNTKPGGDILHDDRAAQEYLAWLQTPGAAEYDAWVRSGGKAFAGGGYYGGGLALVGESGPELINFDNPGMVYTAQQTGQILDNREVVAELRAVRRELADMKAEARRTADAVNGRPEQPMLVENVA